ncbi:deacetylase [Paenibacillus swuensis]|uniref:Deacetylase n=1 Tax=Paenibacillus swuensis TaxID=1178515 RepID=A0A172TMD6_9BACL|nr:bacillithiol biosynthesis deacetylase BshB1 [Paenibacillus swuensis]ANE47943.1 deacetylase [Paenibacillus swuensis]
MNGEQPALDILVFGAHADDAEIGMGGTIVKHTAQGYRVGVCDLTYAEMSSNGTVELRQKEAERASDILGLTVRMNLGLKDRGLFLTQEHMDAVTSVIRTYKPKKVFAPYFQDRHPDHVHCSHLVEQAVFNAKLRKMMPELTPWTVGQLYFYYINDVHDIDLMVDISDVYDRKTAALEAYRSQFEAPGEGKDVVSTPLNQSYLERVAARDRLLGQQRNVAYAEGFASKLPYLVHLF